MAIPLLEYPKCGFVVHPKHSRELQVDRIENGPLECRAELALPLRLLLLVHIADGFLFKRGIIDAGSDRFTSLRIPERQSVKALLFPQVLVIVRIEGCGLCVERGTWKLRWPPDAKRPEPSTVR